MNRLKTTLAAALLACASLAHAAADPVSLETKWNVKTTAISTTGVSALTFDVGGFGAAGYAINGGTQVLNGVDGTVQGSTAPIVLNSTVTAPAQNVVGFSYSILAAGGNASLKIAQTIKTPPPLGLGVRNPSGVVFSSSTFNTPYPAANFAFTTPVISTSAAITIPNNVPFSGTFEAQATNPIFYFTSLTSAATLYISVDYGVPRAQ